MTTWRKLGYCYPSRLEKTLCKWEVYVPLVTKGLNMCLFLDTFMGQIHLRCYSCLIFCCFCITSVTLHVSNYHIICTCETLPCSTEYRFPGHIHLYRFLKSAQSSLGKLMANAALLPREEPPPRRQVKTE
jgi:hypothetical protein